ncbi:hypothetical protein AL035_01400 [Salipiger aestuarii]|uniref:Uncharacterized protein n=1 Tax=Salipiger aestuarii TaxID=568098 RepID=A0A327YN63_9RHOB|nr:hypothetical protein AL035_01400 [Salipiger aestuarii]RAK21961.1 hypothetical protein ATI53_1003117 [Salipiger aestuarii]
MLWLAGLMGMMVLGSVAVIGMRGAGNAGDGRGPFALGHPNGPRASAAPALPPNWPPNWHADRAADGSSDGRPDRPPGGDAAVPDPEPIRAAGFDPARDRLVVVWDDSDRGAPPMLGLRLSDRPGMTDILLDGVPVATLPDDTVPSLDHIALLRESTASALAA